ncbi:MAG TPA: Lrp/AsnC family transcriptional regulator [Nitrososphaerales archaeon]|nr:Lrp/AsnC family transcriptional regulator [Nitrososphaerales archaeon]
MDDIDLKILESLRENARIPLLQLSRSIGVSDVTLHTRIKQLVESGVIQGFRSVIDYERLGFEITAFVQLKVSQGSADAVVSHLRKISWISEIYDVNGEYEILVKMRAKDPSDLRDKVESNLSGTGKIIEKNLIIVLRTEKAKDEIPIVENVGFKGSSGVLHKFSDVHREKSKVQKVVDVYSSRVTEVEILKSFTKALDVGAREIEIVAPGYTRSAENLAKDYKMNLKRKEESKS